MINYIYAGNNKKTTTTTNQNKQKLSQKISLNRKKKSEDIKN